MTRRPSRRDAASGARPSGPRRRPGPGRRTGADRPARTPVPAVADPSAPDGPKSRLTSRAAVLVLVVAVLMVSYASSLKAFLQQRTHINDLKGQIAEREANIDALEAEKQRWSDPAYIEQQARARLGYVMPGERTYLVLDEDGNALRPQSDLDDPAEVLSTTPTPWWSDAWESVELAGHPPKPAKPPATEIDGSSESAG
ncbi:septum formation initiator family protein [Nocardioides sp.]|uniref:FtsB family cell division protein n=1 Tax=Nocardioides sp. TaxID=35761 RepID=UPI001A233B5C|nr:septum formation initiator family protein [Nocardioides sp.]MBJ7359028.1 septum formation initiator family protein [Nocardioides sp.]